MSAAGVVALAAAWRERAETLAPYAPAAAHAFRAAAAELDAALAADADARLTLAEAVLASGIPERTLRAMLADGRVTNVGRKGKPLIRRADLPRRPAAAASPSGPGLGAPGPYDVGADARGLAGRLRAS